MGHHTNISKATVSNHSDQAEQAITLSTIVKKKVSELADNFISGVENRTEERSSKQ